MDTAALKLGRELYFPLKESDLPTIGGSVAPHCQGRRKTPYVVCLGATEKYGRKTRLFAHLEHRPPMLLTRNLLLIALAASPVCYSQEWEVGGTAGYAWSINPSISNPNLPSIEAGFPARVAFGAIFAQNMYEHVGGELRYLFRFGGPQLQYQGIPASMTGYSNAITYDLMIHMASRDVKVRPFVSAGAGIKVYSGTGFIQPGQALASYAILRPVNQVEPAIDLGAGVKWRFIKHAQIRAEFRVYMTPLPDEIFRTTGFSRIHGWVFDFAPQLGVSYLF
jgi:hypothetical protein